MTAQPQHLPRACPVCGAHSLTPAGETSALLAVCDVLVVKALEKLGRRIVRAAPRSAGRFRVMNGRPWHIAHTIWRPQESEVKRALQGAWDVVPAMLTNHSTQPVTPEQVTAMLDEYTRDLAITATAHSFDELLYRFHDRLGLPVYDKREVVTHGY